MNFSVEALFLPLFLPILKTIEDEIKRMIALPFYGLDPLFGSPDVFRLRKEPINSLIRPLVGSGPTTLTVQYFFLIYCMKLCLHMT